jgi:hypothetical protein
MVDAIFDKELDAPDRVRILVQLLGRPMSVEVDPTILRAAGTATSRPPATRDFRIWKVFETAEPALAKSI